MKKILLLALFVVILSSGIYLSQKRQVLHQSEQPAEYNPTINPSQFSTKITNPFFTLPVGRKFSYQSETPEGLERIELEIMKSDKVIMGVATVLYRDKVWVGDELIEDTHDYLAQDAVGNVWYFGEEVNNFKAGQLVDHKGSWIAGEDGALPGIWIKATPVVGDSYKQEYYKGKAEDMTDVVAINQTVITQLATYTDCVKMYDWSPLEPTAKENKYYCPQPSALVVSEHVGKGDRTELVKATPKAPNQD